MKDALHHIQKSVAQLNNEFFEQIVSPSWLESQVLDTKMFHALVAQYNSLSFDAIDGGQAIIFESPQLLFGIIRASIVGLRVVNASSETEKTNSVNKQTPIFATHVHTGYVVIKLEKVQNQLQYITTFYPADSDSFCSSFHVENVLFSDALFSDQHSHVATLFSFVRKSFELFVAQLYATNALDLWKQECKKWPDFQRFPAVVVLDGALHQSKKTALRLTSYLDSITSPIIALSKTCSFVTSAGRSAVFAIDQLSEVAGVKDSTWFFQGALTMLEESKNSTPAVSEKIAQQEPDVQQSERQYQTQQKEQSINQILFVKLHAKSPYVFRLDIRFFSLTDVSRILGTLAFWSRDPVFIGYPYFLVKADEAARVSNSDVKLLAAQALAQFDPLTRRQLKSMLASSDAHSVLDGIKF